MSNNIRQLETLVASQRLLDDKLEALIKEHTKVYKMTPAEVVGVLNFVQLRHMMSTSFMEVDDE